MIQLPCLPIAKPLRRKKNQPFKWMTFFFYENVYLKFGMKSKTPTRENHSLLLNSIHILSPSKTEAFLGSSSTSILYNNTERKSRQHFNVVIQCAKTARRISIIMREESRCDQFTLRYSPLFIEALSEGKWWYLNASKGSKRGCRWWNLNYYCGDMMHKEFINFLKIILTELMCPTVLDGYCKKNCKKNLIEQK